VRRWAGRAMRFVPVKTADQQAALMLSGIREQLVARRTQLSNAIRGYAAEFGVTAAKGLDKIEPLLADIAQDESLPPLARDLFAVQGREYARLQVELKAIEARLMAWHRSNADSRRLARIPGEGPIGATTLVMKTPDPRTFPSGRHFAAWLGLTPKDHSTAGKTRLGKITRAGDERLRSGAGGGSDRRDPAGQARPWPSIPLADQSAEAQAAETRGRGALQQDCPYRLEADGDGRGLRRFADAESIGGRRLRDRPGGGFAHRPGRSCKRSRWEDRSIRGARKSVVPTGPRQVVEVSGTRVAETILASGPNRLHQQPDIWMQAIRSDRKISCGTGAVHIWIPVRVKKTPQNKRLEPRF
jgi:hypothetical protein